MGSIVGYRIDYNEGEGSERPAVHTQQNLTQVPPPPEEELLFLADQSKQNILASITT